MVNNWSNKGLVNVEKENKLNVPGVTVTVDFINICPQSKGLWPPEMSSLSPHQATD